jgi:hypothetical protein
MPPVLRAFAALAALLLPPAALAQPRGVSCPDLLGQRPAPPPALAALLDRLHRAVATRDAAALRAIAAPDIQTSFGGDAGVETLRPGDPTSPVWPRLAHALRPGCAPVGEVWACPGLDSEVPAARGLDAFEQVFVLGTRVRLRAAPALTASVLAEISCRVIRRDSEGEGRVPMREDADPDWVAVALPDGRRGFVSGVFAYSPVGYRALFERQGGAWRMTHFLAGD